MEGENDKIRRNKWKGDVNIIDTKLVDSVMGEVSNGHRLRALIQEKYRKIKFDSIISLSCGNTNKAHFCVWYDY